MTYAFGATSLSRLDGVHPDIVKVMKLAIGKSDLDFTVLEGVRSVARQKQLLAKGATKTMNSRHLTGHAVDIAPVIDGSVSWDWPLYHRLAKTVKASAVELGIPLQWGGDWRTFKDGPHWELPWASYPK